MNIKNTTHKSKFGMREMVIIELGPSEDSKKLTGKIIAIHFYPNKVKYDIEIKVYDEESTRIYNIDEQFIQRKKLNKELFEKRFYPEEK